MTDPAGASLPTAPVATVIIPAHNEESVIATTLETLLAQARSGEFDVIVVCNGCNDRTEEAARQFAGRGVRTFSSPVLSKVAALNLGDHHATTSTRVYIDADVKLSTKSLHRLLEALDDGALVAAPRPQLDLTGCSMAVRMYASVWTRLWHVTRGLGSGVYAISPAGRSAFEEFPDVIADDYFVFCTYPGAARVSPPDAVSIVRLPRTLRGIARRRVRIEQGNAELRSAGLTAEPAPFGVGAVVRAAPWLAPTAALYAAVHLWARRGSTSGGQDRVWHTDASSRSATAERRTV